MTNFQRLNAAAGVSKTTIACAALLLTAVSPARGASSTPAAPLKPLAAVEGITEYRLANGLRVLLFPDDSKPTATVNITYLVGSRHEGYGETGMAHLLEHLVFKGTPNHPNIPQELTAHGARPNGTTWYDRTNYFETFAATEENLEWALDLEADRMVNSHIAKQDLDSEMTVVRNEFEAGENIPQNVLVERILSTMYLWHNYGKSTIGARSDLEHVPIDRLQAFYRKWYQPDNAVLVVAGKFDPEKTLASIVRKFGAIPKPARLLDQTYTAEPAQDGERSATLRRVGDVQAVGVGYHVAAGSHDDFAAVEVLAQLLGDTPSGRLHKSLVETQKATGVYGWAQPSKEPSFLILGADVRKEKSLEDARDSLLATVDQLLAQPPPDREVARARDGLLKDWETVIRSSERAAIALSEWAALGDWRLIFLHRDRLEQVAAADIARVAEAYLRPENRTIGLFVPTAEPRRAHIPEPPDVAALTENYQGRAALAAGEAFDAAPAAVEARLTRSQLPNGAKLSLLPKKTRGATVQVMMTLHLGNETALQGRGPAGSLVPEMLMRGTTRRTREEIQDETDRLKTQLRLTGGPAAVTATIETTRENLAASLRLLGEILRQPAFPETEFGQLRQERLAAIEDSKADPRQKAFTAYSRHQDPWPPSDPRYTQTPEEAAASIAAAEVADARSFWNDFYGAGAAEIAVVGDFDAAEVAAVLGELFADWRSRTGFERLADPYRESAPLVEKLEAPDKENAFFIAGHNLRLQDTDADFAALTLGNFMTGGGFLNSRLASRLRQKDGYSYGTGSQLQASAFEQSGGFFGFAIYAPQNADKLAAAFNEEIAKILESGFTAQEIAEAKQGWLQQRQVSRGVDRELARALATRDYQSRTLAFDAVLESKVEALTGDEILAALRRHLALDKMSVVQAGDFAKAAGSP